MGRETLRTIVDYGERLFLILLVSTFLHAMLANAYLHPYVILLCISETLPVLLMIIRKPETPNTKAARSRIMGSTTRFRRADNMAAHRVANTRNSPTMPAYPDVRP